MSCNVCIGSTDYDYDASGFYDVTRVRRARKSYRCVECRSVIQPGDSYIKEMGQFDGDFYCERTCPACFEIREKFRCNRSVTFGCLWEDMRDYAFPKMTIGCLGGLSAQAKTVVLDRWRKWKGVESV